MRFRILKIVCKRNVRLHSERIILSLAMKKIMWQVRFPVYLPMYFVYVI